ncbi:transcriptional regulator [Methanobrevibacter arboriphilus JCM 13429 = DSM 1125]|uniref:Transcriptional regulator n=1 Tax=Methanobrevibacter arboriphilus JCM 13429 = DSM 1125 TaxID=1300164 RepID=A0A1V6N2Q2_METAZ|nr:GyrI-like domain-containing protein [Methanobrevibacter arboriphilus]OQD58934.1 transcriptional regulator [Methanobrevibacter arboriphilus JCM 13429 = DSM 1125]
MPLVSRIEIVKKSKQPVISIKTTTKMENLPIVIGETYEKIEEYLKEIGEYPEDIPFVRYFNMDMENLKVEIGFPVYKELPGKDDIEFSYIEEMKAVYSLYQGPYQEMGETYDEIMMWIEDNGMKPTGIFLESYYNSPKDVSEDKLLTRILMPLD